MKPASDERTPGGGAHHDYPPPPEQLLTLHSTERDDAVVVAASGAVDGLTAPRLAAAVDSAFHGLGERVLVVDLTEVSFLGSAGLRVLRDSATEAVNRRGLDQLRVVVDNTRPVIRPIEIVGFDQFLSLYDSVEDALTAGEPS